LAAILKNDQVSVSPKLRRSGIAGTGSWDVDDRLSRVDAGRMLLVALTDFVTRHKAHGQLTADGTEPVGDGLPPDGELRAASRSSAGSRRGCVGRGNPRKSCRSGSDEE
jgi:hypothetical protein